MAAALVRVPPALGGLTEALRAAGVADGEAVDGVVFVADPDAVDGWPAVEDELLAAVALAREAEAASAPIVFVVAGADLLGQRGAERAMAAAALLSAGRALAMEGARRGTRANVVAYGAEPELASIARWVGLLLDDDAVSGELVRVGPGHLGGVQP